MAEESIKQHGLKMGVALYYRKVKHGKEAQTGIRRGGCSKNESRGMEPKENMLCCTCEICPPPSHLGTCLAIRETAVAAPIPCDGAPVHSAGEMRPRGKGFSESKWVFFSHY